MPVDASGLEYGLGFLLATAMLHVFGIGLAFSIARFGRVATPRTIRIGGAAMAVAGVGILGGFI
jgi:urease accessory protein